MVLPACGALLDHAEERALFRAIQAGDWHARARLVVSNLPFVLGVAKRYRGMRVPFEDLVAEGALGLLEASYRFDPARGTRFITFATWWIRKRILLALDRGSGRYLSSAALPREVPLEGEQGGPLNYLADGTAADGERTFLRRERLAELDRALSGLSSREREILRLRFGLASDEPKTLVQVAEVIGVSRERVRQIEYAALQALRHTLEPEARVPPFQPRRARMAPLACNSQPPTS